MSSKITARSVVTDFHKPADIITLGETARHRRRILMVSDGGIEFLLDLPQARLLRNNDGLVLEDGRIIKVLAAPEMLYQVHGRDQHHLLGLSWHMGNRHLPTQIMQDHIIIRRDHVIKAMLEGLGARVTEITAVFDPQGGAYDSYHNNADHSHER